MNKARYTLNILAAIVFTLVCASLTQAQATRTWVSGVGDDVNPCSRTAPCKTFAGAISKTAAGGEIDVLDPGGFGTLTVNKSITIDGTQGSGYGSALSGPSSAFVINAGANDVVTLRNLAINGNTTGLAGVRILAAKAVSIENCVIFNFRGTGATYAGRGISDERSAAGVLLYVSDTTVRNNAQSGIAVAPTGGGVVATIINTRMLNNGNAGLAVSSLAKVTVTNSVAAGNTNFGFFAEGPGGASELNLESCISNDNSVGVATYAGSTVTLSNVNASFNTTGVNSVGGSIQSYGNNKLSRNTNGTGPFPGGPTQQ